MCAEMFAEFADKIEKGAKPADVAAEALNKHWKVIFNGNGYGADWPVEAVKRGVWKIDEGWKAIERMGDQKNIDLFEKMKVLTKDELIARRDVDWGHYIGLVEIEAGTMIDMVTQSIVPVLKKEGIPEKAVVDSCKAVSDKLADLHKADDDCKKAELCRDLRLTTMIACRKACDEAEALCPAASWPFATYRELLFLDQNQDHQGQTTKPFA
jgi:glutamine synthetase